MVSLGLRSWDRWISMGHLGAKELLLLGSFHCIQQSSSLPLRTIVKLNIMSRRMFSLTSAKRSLSFSPPPKKNKAFPPTPNHQSKPPVLSNLSFSQRQNNQINVDPTWVTRRCFFFHMHLKGDVIIVSHLVRDLAFTTSTHSPFGPFAKRVKY